MRILSILTVAALGFVLAAPLVPAALAARGKVDSGTAPFTYNQPDAQALQVEAQSWQQYLAQHPEFARSYQAQQAQSAGNPGGSSSPVR